MCAAIPRGLREHKLQGVKAPQNESSMGMKSPWNFRSMDLSCLVCTFRSWGEKSCYCILAGWQPCVCLENSSKRSVHIRSLLMCTTIRTRYCKKSTQHSAITLPGHISPIQTMYHAYSLAQVILVATDNIDNHRKCKQFMFVCWNNIFVFSI